MCQHNSLVAHISITLASVSKICLSCVLTNYYYYQELRSIADALIRIIIILENEKQDTLPVVDGWHWKIARGFYLSHQASSETKRVCGSLYLSLSHSQDHSACMTEQLVALSKTWCTLAQSTASQQSICRQQWRLVQLQVQLLTRPFYEITVRDELAPIAHASAN